MSFEHDFQEEYVNPETLHHRLLNFFQYKLSEAAGQAKECKDKQQPALKTPNGSSEFSKLGDSADANSQNSEETFRSAKRMKMDDYCPVAPQKNQTCSSKSPAAIDAVAMEKQFRESFNTSCQYSTTMSEMQYDDDSHDFIRRKSKNANIPYQKVTVSQEPMDIGPTSGNNTGDIKKDISDSLHLKSSPESPKELRVGGEAAEVQMRIESIQTQPRLEDKETKPGSQRIKSFSIAEVLTTEQLKEHISSVRRWADEVCKLLHCD